MKNHLFLLCLALHNFFMAGAQNSVNLNVRYRPESVYNQKTAKITEMTIKYNGSPAFLKNLAQHGTTNPTVKKQTSVNNVVFTTGKLNADSTFPLTMQFQKTSESDDNNSLPEGTVIYGHGTGAAMPQLDSIDAPGRDADFRKKVLESAQNLLDQIKYPSQTLKVGEKVSVETPVNMPISGANITMNINTTYKLLRIESGTAWLDIKQLITFKSLSGSFTVKGGGSGKGSMQYNISNSYISQYDLDMNLSVSVKMENFSLSMDQKTAIAQSSTLSANNR
jgi:hypothetical protein